MNSKCFPPMSRLKMESKDKGRGGYASPAIICRGYYEILDKKTDKVFRVVDRDMYEKFLAKDSGRYIKAG